jgi:transcriptional regulator
VVSVDAWLRRQFDDLTFSRGSSPSDALERRRDPILRIEGKWKMSQNRPEADRPGVIAGFRETGGAGEDVACERD